MKGARSIIVILIILMPNFSISQTKAKILINNAYLDDYKLYVKYSIQNAKPEEVFDVSLLAYRQNGQLLTPTYVQGDLSEQSNGSDKTIVWNLGKDRIYINETVDLQLKAELRIDYSKLKIGSLMLQSTLLPGYGVYRLDRQKKFYFWTVTGYATAVATGIFYVSALNSYNNYLNSTDPDLRQDYLNKTMSFQNYTYASVVSAAMIWGINYFRTYLIYKSKTKQ